MRQMPPADSQTARQPDAEASLRAELLGTLVAAERELSAQLGDLIASAADPVLVAQCRQQLGNVAAAQDAVGTAPVAALAALRAEVKAAVSAAAALAQQARTATTASSVGEASSVTGAALHSELTSAHANLFEHRIFDSSLTFKSPEDEIAYRRREAEARRYIDQQMGAGTPEGELNAAGATTGQMLDAHAHGAGKSPEFLPQWNRLVETTERHRAALRAEGRSTEEYDRNLTASVRRYLKDKGLTDAQIEASLAASANPLDAVKPFVKDEKEAKVLEHASQRANDLSMEANAPITIGITLPSAAGLASPTASDAPDLADVLATFRAAGVTAGPQAAAGMDAVAPAIGSKRLSSGLPDRE